MSVFQKLKTKIKEIEFYEISVCDQRLRENNSIDFPKIH